MTARPRNGGAARKAGKLKDRLANNRRAERTVPVFTRGDLFAAIQELDLKLAQAAADPDDRLTGNPDQKAIALEIERLRAEMADSRIDFRVRALAPGAWTRLVAEHPPRPEAPADQRHDVNVDTFSMALVRASIVEPAVDDEDWEAMVDEETGLSAAQIDDLVQACWALNKVSASVPRSRAASRILQLSEPE